MKKIYFALAVLILILQARLLSSDGGLGELFLLQEQLKKLETTVEAQRVVNAKLTLQVEDLQKETASIETIARQTLGMVKKDEVFIKVIELKQPEPIVEIKAAVDSEDVKKSE
ncbi:MAG: cell division protein FtsB [Thiomicrorhabdus sp.]|nr:MAG: cell division protein FtsB [Thiomicrorhabdus sp.]